MLGITHYQTDTDYGLAIAVAADLHDTDPSDVIQTLQHIKPDLIVAPGDTMERRNHKELKQYRNLSGAVIIAAGTVIEFIKTYILHKPDCDACKENGYRFLTEAIKIAPVVLSLGNHETDITQKELDEIRGMGIAVLDNVDTVLKFPGKGNHIPVHIGGVSSRADMKWLEQFSSTTGYKILLCHHPEYYAGHIMGTEYDTFDLVIAGHTHGGQWNLCGHPVYAPGQGMFPKYGRGQFGKLVVSAGVSNSVVVPRFGNPCEVVVIHI